MDAIGGENTNAPPAPEPEKTAPSRCRQRRTRIEALGVGDMTALVAAALKERRRR